MLQRDTGRHPLLAAIGLAGALAGWMAFGSAAEAGPSYMEQETACMGDAFRLCADDIPDHSAIEACMQRKHSELSPGCRTVFDASSSADAVHNGTLPR